MNNKDLKRRIIEISWKHKLSHLGSCLTAVDIIDEIYKIKKKDEKFILSAGHAGLALYCVIEKYEGINAEKIFEHHGVHPDKCNQCHLYCSTGSLGQGIVIALGMALANRNRKVYTLISDGEMSEGSVYEAFRIKKEQNLKNLEIYINFNGWGAYKEIKDIIIPKEWIDSTIHIYKTNTNDFPFWKGLEAHYITLNEDTYKTATNKLET